MTNVEESLCARFFREGAKARLSGQFDEALRLFKLSLEGCPASDIKLLGAINGMLSGVERQRGNPNSAENYSIIAINLIPKSQLASIGMFHTLWHQGKLVEALGEVIRLVSLRDSDQYRDLLNHGFRDDLPQPLRKLADKARNILDSYLEDEVE